MKNKLLLFILMFLLLLSFTSADYISDMKEGTIGYYKLENYEDTLNLNNLTTANDPDLTTGKINNSYDFVDTNTDYLETESNFSNGEEFSVSLWMNPDDLSGGETLLALNDAFAAATDFAFFLTTEDDKIKWVIYGPVSAATCQSAVGTLPISSTWYHVVATYNNDTLDVYVNNISVCSMANPQTINKKTTPLHIGKTPIINNKYFDGKIDEIGLFNFTLNTTMIDYLYSSGSPNSTQQYPYSDIQDLEVTLNYPVNNTNYHLIGANQSKVFNGSIVLSLNNDGNCSLNNTLFSLESNVNKIINFVNNSNIPDNNYSIYVNCSDGSSTINMSFSFIIDTIDPNIDLLNPINDSIQKNNFLLNLSYSDLYLYRTNTTISRVDNNQTKYNNFSGDLPDSTLWYNITETINLTNGSYDIGQYKLFMEATDTHTKKLFNENPKKYKSLIIDSKNNKVNKVKNKYRTEFKLEHGKFNIVHDTDLEINTIKEVDRIKFNHIKNTKERTEIIIEGDKLNYLKDSDYPCHFIINDNYWYDCVGFNNPQVKKISNTEYQISYYQDKIEVITDSLGGLNYINKTIFFNVVNETTGLITTGDIFYPPEVNFNYTASSDFTVSSLILNETCIVITGSNISSYDGTYCYNLNSLYLDDVIAFVNMTPVKCFGNISNLLGTTIPTIAKWYNKTDNLIKTSSITNCEQNEICTISTLEGSLIDFNNTFTCVANITDKWFTFQSNKTSNISSDSIGVCDINNIYPISNISYYDEVSLESVSASNGYDVYFNDGLGTINLIGNLSSNTSHSFCTSVNPAVDIVNLDFWGNFNLKKSGYSTRIINLIQSSAFLTSNDPITNISMFIIKLNESSTIEYTWRTTSFQFIDGIMIIKKCNDDGSKSLISSIPVANGFASANLQLFTVPYSYEIIIDNETFIDSTFSTCHVENVQQRDYFVDVDLIDILPAIGLFLVDCRLDKTSNTTAQMTWTANSQDNSNIEGCMIGKRFTVFGEEEVFRNCTTSSVGDFTRTITNPGGTVTITGEITQNGNVGYCQNTLHYFIEDPRVGLVGLSGLFAALIIIMGMTYLLIKDGGVAATIGAAIGYVLSFMLGVLALQWTTVLTVIFLSVTIALIYRYTKKSQVG